MRTFSNLSRIATTTAAVGFLSLLSLSAQTTANSVEASATPDPSGYTTPIAATVPSTTATVWHETAIPADKQITAKVTNGTLIVDGLVAKVQLNYEIHHAGYLYFFVPGVGTAIVSRVQTYGSTKISNALKGTTLAFSTGGHDFELNNLSGLGLAGLGKEKDDVYVRLDTATLSLDRMPMVGFGSTTRAPYAWPLSGPAVKDAQAHFVAPPPMPASLLPRTFSAPAASTTASNSQDK